MEEVTGEVLRYFLLATQYRGPLDFSDQGLKEAKNALNGFYDLFKRLSETGGKVSDGEDLSPAIDRYRGAFRAAMNDDFNTPVAIAELQRLRSDVNKLFESGLSTEARQRAREGFRSLGNVLGLFQLEPDRWQFAEPLLPGKFINAMPQAEQHYKPSSSSVWSPAQGSSISDEEIEGKRRERDEARKQKDFKKADEIRQFLWSHGIVIEDKPDGTSRWKR